MLRYLLDSNLCIRVLRGQPASLARRLDAEAGNLCISMIVYHELLFGAERSQRPALGRERVELFASRLEVLPFDREAAAHAAHIRAELASVGMGISNLDSLIAGHARSRGLIVVTGNLREFQRVPGLRCEDWLGE